MRENNWIYLLQRIILQQVKNIFKPSQFDSRRLKQESKAFFLSQDPNYSKIVQEIETLILVNFSGDRISTLWTRLPFLNPSGEWNYVKVILEFWSPEQGWHAKIVQEVETFLNLLKFIDSFDLVKTQVLIS